MSDRLQEYREDLVRSHTHPLITPENDVFEWNCMVVVQRVGL